MNTLVIAQLPGYEIAGRIYGGMGLSPAIKARDFKDPPKVLVEVRE